MSLSARPGNFGTRFQNFLYQELGLNYIYKAFSSKDLPGSISGIRALGIRGCAVSMPFKEACIPLLDELDSTAAGIQSVNTIVNHDGHLKGYNTDYQAVLDLLKAREVSRESSFILLGSGGMAKATICALRDAGFRRGVIIARNTRTGPVLAKEYGFEWRAELGEHRADLLVNVTPIGMTGGKEEFDLAFPEEVVRAAHAVFDGVAVPSETPLIQLARLKGKKLISGADVIVLQAVEQFVLYTGIRPERDLIERAAAFARS